MSENKAVIKERLDAIRKTLGSTGWKFLVEEWNNDLKVTEQRVAYNAKTFDEVQMGRGVLSVLYRLVNMEKVLDAAEAQLEESAESAE